MILSVSMCACLEVFIYSSKWINSGRMSYSLPHTRNTVIGQNKNPYTLLICLERCINILLSVKYMVD